MASTIYVCGNAVENATSYELFEKTGNTYSSLATSEHLSFEVTAMDFAPGDHTLVVKAKADGYEDSDYSNEVVYTVAAAPSDELAGTWRMNETISTTNFGGKLGKTPEPDGLGLEGVNLYKGYKVNFTAGSQSSEYMVQHTTVELFGYIQPGTTAAAALYMDGKWSKEDYRTIVITSKLSEVDNGEVLLAWLKENGVKQA